MYLLNSLSVCLPACLSVCLSVGISVCPSDFSRWALTLLAALYTYLPTYLPACLFVYYSAHCTLSCGSEMKG
jgi:hypothetical protein